MGTNPSQLFLMKTTITLEVEVVELPGGNKQASVNYILPPGMSLPPSTGLPGATEDQALFNLFRGATPREDLGQALVFLHKAIPALTAPAATAEKKKKKAS